MATYKGKEGYWFTTKTGSHIFVENGEDPEEAIEKAFDVTDEESGFEQAKYDIFYSWDRKQSKKNRLAMLFPQDDLDRAEKGSQIYDDYATQKAQEFLNSVPKVKSQNVEESTRKANLARQNFIDKYTIPNANGGYFWKDSKNTGKRLRIWNALLNNCQRCVMAWYLQYLGYDVMARVAHLDKFSDEKLRMNAPNMKAGNEFFKRGSSWEYSGFIIPDRFEYDYNCEKYLDKDQQYEGVINAAKNYPEGSVFFCSIRQYNEKYKYNRDKDTGHVFIVLNDGGNIKLIEPQTNHEYKDSDVFQHCISEYTRMTRVNDFKLDGLILPYIVQEVSSGGYRK